MLKLFKKLFDRPPALFAQVFRHLSPKDFVQLFQGEYMQTAAFILSFCKKRSYIRQVLKIYDNDEMTRTVNHYLSQRRDRRIDIELTRKVEKFCETTILIPCNTRRQ
jgi:hypothetical protein